MSEFRFGVVGDLHTHWDDVDVRQFDQTDYDLLYFTGDLGGGTPDSTIRIARVMSRLSKPALVMPGNNDTIDTVELAAELTHRAGLATLSGMRTQANYRETRSPNVQLCGYSTHRFRREHDLDVTLIAARPHSMGGPDLSFPEYMLETYGISSMQDSEQRLLALVDQAESEQLIFLSHNGPKGLGAGHQDPWGADFKPDGGDWGDPDLAAAVTYAVQQGKRVLAVIAGHMHLRTRSGTDRKWRAAVNGIHYINAAKVPRIFNSEDDVQRHHLAVVIRSDGVEVCEVLVGEGD